MNILLKIAAIILIISGFVLTYRLDLITSSSAQLAGYDMIEKRVKWGFLIGLGIFLIFPQPRVDWLLTIWLLLATLTFGIIIARLFGFILDGLFTEQVIWLLTEIIVLGVFMFLYWKRKTAM